MCELTLWKCDCFYFGYDSIPSLHKLWSDLASVWEMKNKMLRIVQGLTCILIEGILVEGMEQ